MVLPKHFSTPGEKPGGDYSGDVLEHHAISLLLNVALASVMTFKLERFDNWWESE